MINPGCDRRLSPLMIGFASSLAAHGLLFWGLRSVKPPITVSSTASRPVPIQLITLPPAEPAPLKPAPPLPEPVALPTPAPPAAINGSPAALPPARTEIIDESIDGPAPVLEQPTPDPLPVAPSEPAPADTAAAETVTADTVTAEVPSPSTASTAPPESNLPQLPEAALTPIPEAPQAPIGAEPPAPPSPAPAPDLPGIAVDPQPNPAVYQIALTVVDVDAPTGAAAAWQPPEPTMTQQRFEADPRASACLPTPENTESLGETVLITAQIDADGQAMPTGLLPKPTETVQYSIPLEAGSPYAQLAACLLADWPFEAAIADGRPVASGALISVQIALAP